MRHSFHDVAGYISGLLMIIGMLRYVESIVWPKDPARRTKPNMASYLIWSVIGWLNLIAYNYAGEKETIYFVIFGAVFPTIIFSLSFKFGERKWYPTDTYCLLLAIVAMVIWKTTSNPLITLLAGMSADTLGIFPTLKKINREPFSENLFSWFFGLAASIANLIAVKEWTWVNGVYTWYMLFSYLVIITPLCFGQYKHRAQKALPDG